MTFAALAPTLAVELVALAFAGGASISFMATGNSTLQLGAAPEMRGRVMALWFVAFQGSTPIGGPIVGGVMALPAPAPGSGSARSPACVAALGGVAALRGGLLPRRGPRPVRTEARVVRSTT